MTHLTVITPPPEAPLTLATVKAFLRVGHAGDDELIADLIETARERLETVAGLALVTQTLRAVWQPVPVGLAQGGVRLPRTPAQSIEAVRVIDGAEIAVDVTEQVQLVADKLCLKPWSGPFVVPPDGKIEMDVQVGFGSASDVPEDLQEALLRLIAALYGAGRSGATEAGFSGGLPREVQAILNARKAVRL